MRLGFPFLTARHRGAQILARKGWKSYPKANRLEWIQQQPSQLALVVSNIFWCTYVEDALAGNNPPAKLEQLVDFLVSNLQDLCSQVRTDMANLLRKVGLHRSEKADAVA